jgi:predicted HTH transcriptional regulator
VFERGEGMNKRMKQLAEQAGLITFKFGEQGGYTTIEAVTDLNNLERFAELVRQEEREACAKLCEDQIKSYMSKQYTTDPLGGYRERFASEQCAAVIRGRTE